MRFVIQRVIKASVSVEGKLVTSISLLIAFKCLDIRNWTRTMRAGWNWRWRHRAGH